MTQLESKQPSTRQLWTRIIALAIVGLFDVILLNECYNRLGQPHAASGAKWDIMGLVVALLLLLIIGALGIRFLTRLHLRHMSTPVGVHDEIVGWNTEAAYLTNRRNAAYRSPRDAGLMRVIGGKRKDQLH